MGSHFLHTLTQAIGTLVAAVKGSPEWAFGVAMVPGAAIVIKIAKGGGSFATWVRSRRAQAVASALQAKTHVQSFTDDDIVLATTHYIEPDCSNLDPTNERDLRRVVGVREQVFATIDRSLELSGKTHLLVLADSGMGKTTFLLNFFARELRRREKKRRPMALVPLGRPDSTEQIGAVANKRDTILLLDALDEDVLAIENYRDRLKQLMKAASDFKAVVLTCRTQFFTSDADIPFDTTIPRVSPRRAGTAGEHEFRKVYLMPFTEQQIKRYVQVLFPIWQRAKRDRAFRVVSKIPELSVRPMLLALLPELMQREDDLAELWELYTFMVDNWLKRESNWVVPEKLLADSERIAVNLVLNRSQRGTERISREELAWLLQTSTEKIEEWKLTTRSLLNRDSMGQFKFAHRSIMEFLFVRSFIEGNDECATVQWTDLMCDLFLSWGRSAVTGNPDYDSRTRHLLMDLDLSKTGLFPVAFEGEPASTLDVNWARSRLNPSGSARERAGVASSWRHLTSRYIDRQGIQARAYDFAEGLIWQYTKTCGMDSREERELYRVGRYEQLWRDSAGSHWTAPKLSEFRSLVESLQSQGQMDLDDRELYWLADHDSAHVSMARVRRADDTMLHAIPLPGGAEMILSGRIGSMNNASVVDVYKLPKIQFIDGSQQKAPLLQAQAIKTYRGDAQTTWRNDRDGSYQAWKLETVSESAFGNVVLGFTREKKLGRRDGDL